MTRAPLGVRSFGGGVVLFGSPDSQRTDEMVQADQVDIGPRGALFLTTERTPYVDFTDFAFVPAKWARLWGLASTAGYNFSNTLAVGEGSFGYDPFTHVSIGNRYLLAVFQRTGEASPVAPIDAFTGATRTLDPLSQGVTVTTAEWAGLQVVNFGAGAVNVRVFFVCIGAREGTAPVLAPGLFALVVQPPLTHPSCIEIGYFDALGTGVFGELRVGGFGSGTHGKFLAFRGIIGYNGFIFGWGYDSADATNGDGPARVMFCNLGLPLKWGNDNQAAVGTDRAFTDSDAIVLGDAGEIIRGAVNIFGKLIFGTNKALHYIAGYGRDSFLTDGATPLMKSFNVLGPHCLLEGPDKKLYGVGDQGLWRMASLADVPEALFWRVTSYDGSSPGYWDLIWSDPNASPTDYPGRTNGDLVWMQCDYEKQQVLVVIPFCDGTNGSGPGSDTVIIKYHVATGGFTRQVCLGVALTAGAFLRAETQLPAVNLVGTGDVAERNVGYYGPVAGAGAPPLPLSLPVLRFGPYAPFGPDGRGSLRRLYLTIAWSGALTAPLLFQVATIIDGQQNDAFGLAIGPYAMSGPVEGDLWLDTSLLDQNLGNVAGAITAARPEYILRRRTGSATWAQVPGVGGQGQRATVRLPLSSLDGTRVEVQLTCTDAKNRFQVEGLGELPGGGNQSL